MKSFKTIIFIVRFPESVDLQDGYFKRVSEIDSQLSDFIKIYINYENKLIPLIKKIKEKTFEINTSKYNPVGLVFIFFLSLIVDAVYFHSIYRLRSFFHKFIYLVAKKRILDLHGVVPDELRMQGKVADAEFFEKIEKFGVQRANIVIGVTQKMLDYITEKHALGKNNKKILLPILPEKKELPDIKDGILGNEIIYSGGLQEWQQIEKMLDYVYLNKEKYRFTFLIPDPQKLKGLYLEKYQEDFPGLVASVSADKVNEYYRKNAFGLVLRADSVVNNVACPTKLAEYIQNDIVPIVDYANIGDFNEMGYGYVKYGDALPNKEEWEKMIIENKEVLKKMHKKFNEGVDALRKSI